METKNEHYSILHKDLITILKQIGDKANVQKTNKLMSLISNNCIVYQLESSHQIDAQVIIKLTSNILLTKNINQRKSFLLNFEDNLRYYIDELNATDPIEFKRQEDWLRELLNFIIHDLEFINTRDSLLAFTDNENIFLDSEKNYSTFEFNIGEIQDFITNFKRDILKLDYLYWLQKEYRKYLDKNADQREILVPLINYVERNIFRIDSQLNSPDNLFLYVNENESQLKMYMVSKIHFALKKTGIKVNSEKFAESFGYQLTNSFKNAYTTKVKKNDEKWENFIKTLSS